MISQLASPPNLRLIIAKHYGVQLINLKEFGVTAVILTPGACSRGTHAAVDDTGSGGSGGKSGKSGKSAFPKHRLYQTKPLLFTKNTSCI